MTELEKKDKNYIIGTYNRFPVDILNGKGSFLTVRVKDTSIWARE